MVIEATIAHPSTLSTCARRTLQMIIVVQMTWSVVVDGIALSSKQLM